MAARKKKKRASRRRRKTDADGKPILTHRQKQRVRGIIGNRRSKPQPAQKYTDETPDRMVAYFQERLDELEDAERITTDKGAVSYINKPVRPPTFAGFAAEIGVASGTLWEWKERHEVFKEAHSRCNTIYEQILVEMGAMGGFNQRHAEFLLKNHHGYKDKAEVELGGKVELVIDDQDSRVFNT